MLDVTSRPSRGYETTPIWEIKPPTTFFLAIFDFWGWFVPPKGVVLSTHLVVWEGGGYHPFRVALSPLFGWFYPPPLGG